MCRPLTLTQHRLILAQDPITIPGPLCSYAVSSPQRSQGGPLQMSVRSCYPSTPNTWTAFTCPHIKTQIAHPGQQGPGCRGLSIPLCYYPQSQGSSPGSLNGLHFSCLPQNLPTCSPLSGFLLLDPSMSNSLSSFKSKWYLLNKGFPNSFILNQTSPTTLYSRFLCVPFTDFPPFEMN